MANRIYDPYGVKATHSGQSTLVQNVSAVGWSAMGGSTPVGGDNELWATAVIPQMAAASVTITCSDFSPGLTVGMHYSSGVTASCKIPQATTVATLTVAHAVYNGDGGNVSKGGGGSVTHSFSSFSADGSTNPVSWASAG